MSDQQDDGGDQPSRRGTIAAMAVIVVLVVACIWIAHVLSSTGRIQDCVMAGRRNCAPVSQGG